MKAHVVLDIETVPLAASLAVPYPAADRSPPATYKSDDAITRWRESDESAWRAARVKECSLNPRLGRVVVVGMIDSGVPDHAVTAEAPTESDEADMLRDAWAVVAGCKGHVVTWNGSFDLRFLLVRSMLLGVDVPIGTTVVREWFRRYQTAPHCDVKALLTNWEPPTKGEGLDEWAQAFGVAGKTGGMNGAAVYPAYVAGDIVGIASYCLGDVAATSRIYHAIGPTLDPEYGR